MFENDRPRGHPSAITRRSLLASTILAVPAIAAAAKGRLAEPYKNPALPIAERVRDLLSRMTLEEKTAQMRCMWFSKTTFLENGSFSPDKARTVLADGIGQIGRPNDTIGIVQPGMAGAGMASPGGKAFRTIEDGVRLVNAIQRHLVEQTRLGIPALFHEESAHGFVARGATIFPVPPALASTWDPELVEQAFTVAAREARLRGATVVLSPVLDLARDPRYGRVEEFFSEDAFLTSRMVVAAVRGLQGPRPLARDRAFVTLKHFVHGTPAGGLNIAPAQASERELREAFLVPFSAALSKTVPAIVMPSYNEVDGVPAHANRSLLQKVGRERLGFHGAYFSDYSGIANLKTQHRMATTIQDAAVLAMAAGVDADLPDGEAYQHLPDLVRSGRVAQAQVDDAVGRILAMKFEAGIFETPYLDLSAAVRETNTPADVALARKTAVRSVVLLKNTGILPLDPQKPLTMAVIGPNAVLPLFGGYSTVNDKAVGVLEGLRKARTRWRIEHSLGVDIVKVPEYQENNFGPIVLPSADENRAGIAAAVEVARRADVVLMVVGDRPEITRESINYRLPGDRSSLDLFGAQNQLVDAILATGKPVVALLLNGRALAIETLAAKADAILEGWYLGQEGGYAVADILTGVVNPGGKLPVTFPRSSGELPAYYNRHPSADISHYVEGERAPLFAFGHGLSYTQFAISAPRLAKAIITRGETAAVEIDVTNVGRRSGDEVVQLYIRDEVSSVPRPILELRGFQRVTLQPGERRTVSLKLEPDDLAFWDIDMNWSVEPGTFAIGAGASSTSLKTVTLTVT